MAEYYEESRNEGPNLLGMAGLLGLGALAGAGGYYALRNARGKNAAAEALTRAARSERPRGVQMGDLSSRVTGDFGYDPRITGNTQLPTPRASRVTGDRVTGTPQRPVAPHAPEQYSNVPPSVPPTVPTSTLVDRRVQANYAAIARELGDYPGESWTPPLDPSVSYGNLTRERGETIPSAETRARAYANAAAKSVSELPRVTRPQSGISESMLITDPNTGEIYRRGGGGSYFASKAPAMEAGALLTDLPQVTTSPATGERMVRRQGRMVPLSSIKQKQPAIPTATIDLSIGDDLLDDIEFVKQVELDEAERYSATPEAQAEMRRATRNVQNIEGVEKARAQNMLLDFRRELENNNLKIQTTDAVESGAAQQTGRVWQQLSRNEDLDKTQIAQLEAQADADYKAMLGSNPSEWSGVEGDVAINTIAQVLPDGLPVDQAEGVTVRDLVSQGKPVFDLRQKQAVRISPRALDLGQEQDPLVQEALQYLRAQEIDTDFDYSAENIRQAAQVRDRIETAQALQNQANQILADLQAKKPVSNEQLSPQEFAAAFNRKYREELNPELQLVDNARQRQELRGAQAAVEGEDVASLLLGDVPEVEFTMRGKALRGGKPNRAGDISYMDESGQEYASADTGVKARQGQGEQYKARAERLNKLRSASDEELTDLVLQGQQALANNQPITKLDADTTRFASQLLQTRAVNNPEPTRLQLDALDRARASIAATQEILQSNRNPRPTIAPGPAQDVARAMETLRRGMIVDPSEPLPELPSVQQLRTGYASDEEIGPILGASDVYTGAAAEAAGPVIFTGKSKANTVLKTPPITGSIGTPTGRYLTQDNPDVLGTVYNVAGTPANRAIASQVEANAQAFLADAIAGGLQAKGIRSAEPYVTPARLPGPLLPPTQGPALPSLGMSGIDPSKRTLYSQYRQGVSATTPLSPFIGEMSGGTVIVSPPTTTTPGIRRDIGAPAQSIDLTRRGEKSRYFSLYPQQEFITGIEPEPIGPIAQSPGLSRIGGMTQQTVQGAGGLPVTQLTPQGQRIAYPRMDKPAKALGFRGETITNVPRYGIDPGAEDWRDDLMRSAYRRGGPIRTYKVDPNQL
jgi:hypothetical protein